MNFFETNNVNYFCFNNFRSHMSCIFAVVRANDKMLAKAHNEFELWRQTKLADAKAKPKSLFRWALQHFNARQRSITALCPSFESPKTYARAIATTYVEGGKLHWQHPSHPCWKQAGRTPPPETRSGAPMRVLYTSEREAQCTCVKEHAQNCLVVPNLLHVHC